MGELVGRVHVCTGGSGRTIPALPPPSARTLPWPICTVTKSGKFSSCSGKPDEDDDGRLSLVRSRSLCQWDGMLLENGRAAVQLQCNTYASYCSKAAGLLTARALKAACGTASAADG